MKLWLCLTLASSLHAGTAALVAQDITTVGTWSGTYGSDGYNVSQHGSSIPAYATVNLTGATNFDSGNTMSTSGLQIPGDLTHRSGGIWYTATTETLDIALTSGSHQIALYFWDFDNTIRSAHVKVLDQDNSGAVIFDRYLNNFSSAPVWFVWNCSGHIAFTISNVSGAPNTSLNGYFFDPVTQSALTVGSITFKSTDSTTSGSWVGTYGSTGYNVIGDTLSLPGVSLIQGGTLNNNGTTGTAQDQVRASNHAQHVDAVWFVGNSGANGSMDIPISCTGSLQVAAYFYDIGQNDVRVETATMIDPTTGNTLESAHSLASYSTTPKYFVWLCSGNVALRVTSTTGNAIVNSFFFDPGSVPKATMVLE